MKKTTNIFLLLALVCFTTCKKDDLKLDLEYDVDIKNLGLVIDYIDSVRNIPVERSYLLTPDQNSGHNFAYPELTVLKDSSLMMVAKSSNANIEDFAKADLIKLISNNRGRTWKKGEYFSTAFPDAINSSMPSIVRIDENRLLLIYLVKYNNKRIVLKCEESSDNGKTWSAPKTIYGENEGYQIINNSRAILAGSRVIIPVCIPHGGNMNNYLKQKPSMLIYCYYSDDYGKTWKKTKAFSTPKYDLLEPGIVWLKDKELLMTIRTDVGKVLFARSYNLGDNWQFEESNINSPSSPQSIKRIPGTNTLVMVWNDNNQNSSSHGGNRSPLSLATSINKGKKWKKVFNLEPFNNFSKDHSYVAIEFDNDFAYFLYNERNNTNSSFAIKMSKIKLKDLE